MDLRISCLFLALILCPTSAISFEDIVHECGQEPAPALGPICTNYPRKHVNCRQEDNSPGCPRKFLSIARGLKDDYKVILLGKFGTGPGSLKMNISGPGIQRDYMCVKDFTYTKDTFGRTPRYSKSLNYGAGKKKENQTLDIILTLEEPLQDGEWVLCPFKIDLESEGVGKSLQVNFIRGGEDLEDKVWKDGDFFALKDVQGRAPTLEAPVAVKNGAGQGIGADYGLALFLLFVSCIWTAKIDHITKLQ